MVHTKFAFGQVSTTVGIFFNDYNHRFLTDEGGSMDAPETIPTGSAAHVSDVPLTGNRADTNMMERLVIASGYVQR